MPNHFLDTSALVKMFHREAGSERILPLLDDSAQVLYVSWVGYVEFHGALARKVRERVLALDQLDLLVGRFRLDCENHVYELVPTTLSIRDLAANLLRQHGGTTPIRSLDALQAATALHLHQTYGSFEFVSSDRRLLMFADALGLPVLDPMRG